MTGQEAIAIIEREIACVNKECNIERACAQCELVMPSKEPIIEAYKLAIAALRAQPCVKNSIVIPEGATNGDIIEDLFPIDDSFTTRGQGMTIIDADKFLAYLIYSKHIDGLTCGEVKEAIEMCKVDVLGKIRAEIIDTGAHVIANDSVIQGIIHERDKILEIIDKYRAEQESKK